MTGIYIDHTEVCYQTDCQTTRSLHSTMTAASLLGTYADEQAFLDSVEGEISFFRSIMRARPLGKHRHFHILTVRNAILRDTGRSVHIESIWEKLRRCYNIDVLEVVVSLSTETQDSSDSARRPKQKTRPSTSPLLLTIPVRPLPPPPVLRHLPLYGQFHHRKPRREPR